METGVEFVAADMPMANRLTVHVLAAVAEHEREMISQRTKAALGAAKARGTWKSRTGRTVSRLGNPNGARALRAAGAGQPGWTSGASRNRAAADRFARELAPVIETIRSDGVMSLEGIATELNARGILTARGDRWYATTVRNLLTRQSPR
jgi:DNA invertase Pin-like site-specific DNA recombinase